MHLLERLACIHALVLASIADEQDTILWANLLKESLHLPRARQARLVEHIEVPCIWIARTPFCASAREEALKGVGLDSGIAELPRGPASWGKTFYGVPALLGTLTDGFKHGCLATPGPTLQGVDAVG